MKLAGTRNVCFFFTWPYIVYNVVLATNIISISWGTGRERGLKGQTFLSKI